MALFEYTGSTSILAPRELEELEQELEDLEEDDEL